jgi:hypothetical protein
MNGKDIINLQEAYLQVYSQPEISEEAEIAAEYFYEQGLNEEDVEDLIEELGVEEFNELVYEILESYGITEISEASAAQNWIARQILQGMERHKQATQKLGQSKAGKALGSVERGLTTVGDVGFRASDAAANAIDRKIEKVKSARGSQTKSSTEREPVTPVTRRHRSHGKVKAGPRPIGRPSSVHSKPGTRSPQPYRSSRQTPALPPWGMTGGKKPRALSAKERSSRLTKQNIAKGFGSEPVQVKKEDFELWVNTLLDEGYDLSDYTWDDMMEIYEANVVMSVKSPEGKFRALNVTKARPSRNLQGKERLDAARTMRQKDVDTRFKDQGKVKQFRRRHGLPEEHEFILSHLLDEGYAESLESAQAILNSMSEEWVAEILDEVRGFGGYIPKGGTTYSGHYDDEHPGSKGSGKSDGGIKHYYARGTESGLSMSPSQRANLAAKRARREGTPEGRRRANKILTRITSAH